MMTLKRLNVIVALDNKGGIGKNNRLPWKIREDMLFFSEITSKSSNGRQNAVILGRNTWDSIPPKFRPLPNRVNVVVSTTLESVSSGVHLARSFEDSLKVAERLQNSGQVDEVFVIGGARLYKEALRQRCYPIRVYCTHVIKAFDCDVFFPEINFEKYKTINLDSVDTQVKHSGDIDFRFAVYEACNAE